MKLITAMLADSANVHDGKLFIHGGGWSSIGVAQLPAVHPTLSVIWVFRTELNDNPEDFTVGVDLVTDDGEIIIPQFTGKIFATDSNPKSVAVPMNTLVPGNLAINMLEFKKPGEYTFRIYLNGDVVEELPFIVHLIPTIPELPAISNN